MGSAYAPTPLEEYKHYVLKTQTTAAPEGRDRGIGGRGRDKGNRGEK